MNDIARLFQQQVPLDSKVKIFLAGGKEAAGRLDEISRNHVTLRNQDKPVTVFFNMIGGWEVIEDTLAETADLLVQSDENEASTSQDLLSQNANIINKHKGKSEALGNHPEDNKIF